MILVSSIYDSLDGRPEPCVHTGWSTWCCGVWELPGSCACLCRTGLVCRSNRVYAYHFCRTRSWVWVGTFIRPREPLNNCCFCWHANWSIFMGPYIRYLWKEVVLSLFSILWLVFAWLKTKKLCLLFGWKFIKAYTM